MLTSALLCFASVCAPQTGPSSDGLAAVRAVFLRTEGSTSAPDDVLVRRLTALGSAAAPTLFDLASGAALESFLGDRPDEAWLCPLDRVGPLALTVLTELPQVPVRDLLRARCTQEPVRETRTTALRVLGAQGTAESLELVLALCIESGEELLHPSVREPAVAALRNLLNADAETLRRLEDPLLAAPLPLQTTACEALAACGRADSVALLTRLFGHGPELDLAALEALTVLGERFAWSVGEPVSTRLRVALERGTPELQAAAARGLGRTRDLAAVPALVGALEKPALARASEWALREITGERRCQGAPGWQAWLEREHAWSAAEAERHLAHLDPRREGSVSSALRVLLAHPLERERTVMALGSALGDYDPDFAVSVCATLEKLGSRRAVPSLVDQLAAPDERVRAAAGAALRTLTGADLPNEPRLWEEYLAGT